MRGMKTGFLGMFLLTGVLACGPDEDLPRQATELEHPVNQDTVNGTLLARIQLTPGHEVAFYEMAPGELAARESGNMDLHPPRLERENLTEGSWVELYKRLSGELEAPRALVEADTRRALRTAHPLPVSPAEAAPPEPGRTRALGAWESWEGDAAWFSEKFCASNTDERFCATNVTQSSRSAATSYFNTVGMSADFSKTANFYTYHWSCGELFCLWTLDSNTTLSPRHYSSWTYSTPGSYMSELFGNDGNLHVHYSARWNTPWGTFTPAAVGTYPFETNLSWTDQLQGITHDASSWYITNSSTLMKFPVTSNLDTASPQKSSGIPQYLKDAGYNHMGGLDHFNGKLYIPLHGPSGLPSKLLVYNAADLKFIAEADHPNFPGALPWVAMQPETGLLYTSAFDADKLTVFKLEWIANTSNTSLQLELSFVKDIPLKDSQGNPVKIYHIQGGAFSSRKSHLYLATNEVSQGILGFDALTGRQQARIPVDFDPGTISDEVEGLTIWDLDGGQAPGISGQVHMILVDVDWPSNDDFSLKHYKVSSLSKL